MSATELFILRFKLNTMVRKFYEADGWGGSGGSTKPLVISSADDLKRLALQLLTERLEWGIQLYEKGYGYIPPEKFGLQKAIEIIQSM